MRLLESLFNVCQMEWVDDTLQAVVTPNLNHDIFMGHFPGQPVTPGVCLIEMVTELVEDVYGMAFSCKAIDNAKFLRMLVPKEGLEVRYDICFDIQTLKTRAVIASDDEIYAKISMTLERD